MNELTGRILGAIGLGLAGTIGIFFLVFNKWLKRWLTERFGGTPPPPPKPKDIQSIDLIGHWRDGEWRYTLKGHLRRNQGLVEGQFEWTFQGFPTGYKHSRWANDHLGLSGIEFVGGVLAGKTLKLNATKVSDPHNLGILQCDYTIEIDEEAQTFSGKSVEQVARTTGSLEGHLSVQR